MTQLLRLIRYLIPYRVRLIGAFLCSAVVAGLAGAYAWLVRPVLDGIFISKDERLLIVLPLAMLAVIYYQNWRLATLSVVVIPLSAYTMVRMGGRLRNLATRGQERIADMASTLQEALAGIRIVKAFGREEAEALRFKDSNRAF